LHLLVEADGPTEFERGVRGLAIRIARTVNRLCGRRGSVWADRYHARLLRTPREVRNALVYVLNNFKKHLAAATGLDPYSSARWFFGWKDVGPAKSDAPIATARTWLLRVGWRRHGAIAIGGQRIGHAQRNRYGLKGRRPVVGRFSESRRTTG
jgi:hypothetical protein